MASTIKNINKINQLISENIDDLVFICNENFECVYYNIKELKSEKNILDFLHPEDSKRVIEFVENTFKSGYGKEEFRIIGDNNHFRWYEIKGKRFFDDDNTRKVFLICRDISRIKNVEKEIKKSQIRYTQLADTLPEIKYWKLLQSKKSITAVQKTREMLEVVINNIPQLIYWKDTKLVYLGCNTNFATINGLVNPHSIIGRTDDDLNWVIDKLDYIQECEHNVMRKDESEYNVIELLVTPDGKQAWYEINRIPLHDMGGNVVGILVTYEDISIRKFSEQKLKESEEKYRHLVENIPDAIYSALPDETGTTTFMSNRWKDWTGYFPEDFYKDHETWPKSIHQEDRDGTIKKYIDAFKEKTEYSLEYRVVHKDSGEIRYVRDQGVPIFDEKGNISRFDGVVSDVTDQKIAEQELRNSQEELKILNKELEEKVRERTKDLIDSERQYRTTINSLGDPLHVVNKDLRIILVNQALKTWLGELNLDVEIFGRRISEVFPFLDPKIYDEYKQVFDTGIPLITMEKNLLPEFEVITEIRKIPMFSEGKVEQIITIIRDVTENKKAEQKLKEEREKVQNYLDIAGVILLVLNADQTVQLINRKGCEILEEDEPEIIGINWIDKYIPETNRETVKREYNRFINGEIELFEYTEEPIIKKNGEKRIIAWHNRVLRNQEGKVIGALSSGEDITERKKKEEEIRLQSEIIENMSEGIYLIKLDYGTIVYTNPAFEEMFGYNPGEMIGEDVAIVNAPTDKTPEETKDEIMGILSETGEWHGEVNNIKKDGTPFWCYVNVSLFDHPEYGKVSVSVHTDITERKKAEQKLKESEINFRNMVNNLDVAFYRGIYKGKLLMHNQACNIILGLEPNESIVGAESTQFFANERTRKKYYEELEEKGFVRNFFAQVKKSNGEIITVDLNAHVIYNSEGEITEAEGTFTDITEKFKLQQDLLESERKLREQNIELMKLDEVKNDFITMAAHELKTPLISISGYTDYILMKHRNRLSSEITEDLKVVQRNATRLEVLMDQLLDVVKIDMNKLKLQKEQVNITKIINDCLDELSYLINEKNLEIILNINHEIMLNVDPNRIFTVFTNLISNAIKFTPDYGWIEISGKRVEGKYIFEVKDNGIGLAEDELPRLFIKFERIKQPILNENLNIKDSGTGLGLYITKSIVNLHNGEIRAISEGLNKGTTFEFTLPTR